MINESTLVKLNDMKLSVMGDAFREQMKDPSFSSLSFEERFGLVVDAEWARRKNNRLRLLIQKAGFSENGACMEDIEYHPDRKLDKSLLARLSTCGYIRERHNVIVTGASGAGKSFLVCALGVAACRNFFKVRFMRLPDLFIEIAVARAEGTYKKFMKQLKKVDLLILDEWMLLPLTEHQAQDLLEIVEARHKKASTIFASQFSPRGWHAKIGEDTLADAILDRIVHNSYAVHIEEGSMSMRERKGLKLSG